MAKKDNPERQLSAGDPLLSPWENHNVILEAVSGHMKEKKVIWNDQLVLKK